MKRVDTLIDAFADVWRNDNTVRLLIGGSGDQEAALREQVLRLGLGDAVTFLGNIPREEVATFYSDIDAFVLTSESETMGVVQIEALAAGVPVISTRTWGGSTVIGEGDGELIDIGDHQQLVDAMVAARTAADTEEERAGRAQRSVARFGEDAFLARYMQIYGDAIG